MHKQKKIGRGDGVAWEWGQQTQHCTIFIAGDHWQQNKK